MGLYKDGHGGTFGYCYKNCPFSTSYATKYYDQGFNGNSNYPNLPVPPGDITDHTTTDGNMVMRSRGGKPGWVCKDPNCGFYLKYGRFYFEY